MRLTRPSPLGPDHAVADFDCGEEALNDWLRRHARAAEAHGTSRTFVTCHDDQVVGYYSLAAGQIAPADAFPRAGKGQPAKRPLPVVLLARLAVDRDYQNAGVGRSLLQDALFRCAEVSDEIGFQAVVVHATDVSARRFYERFHFEASPTDPLHLILLMNDLRKLLGEA